MVIHRHIRPELQGNLFIWKRNGVLSALDCGGYEERNESVTALLELADAEHDLPDFPLLRIWTEDRPVNAGDESWRVLSFSTRSGYRDIPVPDFLFDRWESVGIEDYELAAAEVAAAGEAPATLPLLGWVGNCETTSLRWDLHRMGARHPDLLEVRHVVWVPQGGGEAMTTVGHNHLSLREQVARWAYLIDVEGRGWSARMKLLLHSGRPLLLQARPYREWFFDDLVPMEHFIPVRADFGDLIDRVRWAQEHPERAAAIGRAGQAFARRALTRAAAVRRWAEVLTELAGSPVVGYGPPELCALIDPLLAQVGAPLLAVSPSQTSLGGSDHSERAATPDASGVAPAEIAVGGAAPSVPEQEDPSELPMVSALVPAYNYEEFVGRAIQSALEQDYPAERLEVVVVDDGSTDRTAEIVRELAERNPGRIRLIQQENSGYVAATSRAVREARGDLLALLDADDMWLPLKTRRQVEVLIARPELGMVFCDMVVVDAEERVRHPSLSEPLGKRPQLDYARILHQNVATQSAIMFRRELVERVLPVPDEVPYADWWVALRSAQFAEVHYLPEPLSLYRVHGSNLTGNVTGAAAAREARKALAFQRHALVNLPIEAIPPDRLEFVWSGVEGWARKLIEAAESHFVVPWEVTAVDRAHADALLADATRHHAAGNVAVEAALILRALALDPYRLGLRRRLADAVARHRAACAAPDPLQGASGFIVLADAEELLADDALLAAYAERMASVEDVLLAIDASRLPLEAASEQLQALVNRLGLGGDDGIALIAIAGERDEAQRTRILSRAHARYRAADADVDAPLPAFTPATLGDLRARVALAAVAA